MSAYKTMKVFDCQEMPADLRKKFFDRFNRGNDTYVKVYVHDEQKPRSEYNGGEVLYVDTELDFIVERGDDPISDYLYDSGAGREAVLVKHWW